MNLPALAYRRDRPIGDMTDVPKGIQSLTGKYDTSSVFC